ncbi:hypothetical protein MMC13_001844 [Lambiella insularis]|nr:hypothetical protein [Lambiella insularis]
MRVTNFIGLALVTLAPALVLGHWSSEGLIAREAFPEAEASEYYGNLVGRDAEAEAAAYYSKLYAREAALDSDWIEYQALKRRNAFQKRGKVTKKQVADAETAYEGKLDDIQLAESDYKHMTEGPGKVAFKKKIDAMENAAAQLKARHARLKDQLARGQ